jgi:hypothetical protein
VLTTAHSMRSMLIATVKLAAGSDLSSCPTSHPFLDDGMTILYCSAYGLNTQIHGWNLPTRQSVGKVLPAARIGSTSPTLGRRLETNQSFTFGCGADIGGHLVWWAFSEKVK